MVFNEFKNNLAKLVFMKQSPTMPTSYKIGFSTTVPNVAGTGITEPVGNYTKQVINFKEPVLGECTNNGEITFGPANREWGQLAYVVIFDQLGNPLFADELSSPVQVNDGDVVKIADGAAKVFIGDAVVGV